MIVWKTPEVIEEAVGAALKYLINKTIYCVDFLERKRRLYQIQVSIFNSAALLYNILERVLPG